MPLVLLLDRCRVLLLLALWLVLAIYLAFFTAHVVQMLAYPFPLDYGEGPLLAQVERLRAGTPIWQLYADPGAPPFLVVNYPPVYLLLCLAVSFLTGNTLLAGRLISLIATLGSVVALLILTRDTKHARQTAHPITWSPSLLVAFSPCLLLSIPVVREWAGYMRVDALALCLGLWGLVGLKLDNGQRTKGEGQTAGSFRPLSSVLRPLLAGLLLVGAVYTKPSMVAAPLAGGMWWLLAGRAKWRVRLLVLAVWAAFALVPLVWLQWASGGWFWFHVVTANANRWDATLASQFWADQARLRWPLAVAGAIGSVMVVANRNRITFVPPWVPALYTLVGVGTAIGVGKVGAYANYFLELYAGLVWLTYYALERRTDNATNKVFHVLRSALCILLVLLGMFYYPPMWSRETVRVAGLLEPNPPQPFFRRSTGLWRETTREAEILDAQRRVQAAITAEVQATGGPIFTDTPGIAAQAQVTTPFQAFEHRQILDSGHWDQRPTLRDLANGAYPLAVIDFLGNWMTPEMIDLITHRYAQDGAFGTFDMYRPVESGPLRSLNLSFGDLQLRGYRLAPPDDGATYSPGTLLPLTLEWSRPEAYSGPVDPLEVVVQLTDGGDLLLLEETRSLLYGALPPNDWLPNQPVQHMQPFTLPEEMLPRTYTIAVGLRANGAEITPPQPVATIAVGDLTGQTFETGWNVPAPILAAWESLGGIERAGLPLTPAVPFAWGRLQCFEYLCLEQRGDEVIQRPLGERLFLGETIRGDGVTELREPFRSFWQSRGGEASFGLPISGEVLRNAYIVQWTRYARLERHPETDALGLGRLGDDSLRLSPGMRYRWPSPP